MRIFDAFVVKYCARGGQRHLPLHRDQSTHSFTIALNASDAYGILTHIYRERERERERKRERDRETEGQRDRETERQRDRETERQRERQRDTETQTEKKE